MKLTKLRVTTEASNRLRFVAGKTGLTPNLLCRLGFCLSLREPKVFRTRITIQSRTVNSTATLCWASPIRYSYRS